MKRNNRRLRQVFAQRKRDGLMPTQKEVKAALNFYESMKGDIYDTENNHGRGTVKGTPKE